MNYIPDVAELSDRIANYRLPIDWKHECSLEEMTRTPGIFYHGSPELNIDNFRAEIELDVDERRISLREEHTSSLTAGVFFSQNPSYAAIYASKRGDGGRIHEVELVTKNPIYISDMWFTAVGLDRQAEDVAMAKARSSGYDCIVSFQSTSLAINEIIVLDASAIKRRDVDIMPLDSSGGALIGYRLELPSCPEYASDCIQLFGSRKAAETHGSCSAVLIDADNPLYCDQRLWPRMDFDILRHFPGEPIDCLVDPRDGSALVVDPTKVAPLNRKKLKTLQSMQRRRAR